MLLYDTNVGLQLQLYVLQKIHAQNTIHVHRSGLTCGMKIICGVGNWYLTLRNYLHKGSLAALQGLLWGSRITGDFQGDQVPPPYGWKRHLDKHSNYATLTLLEPAFSISEEPASSEYKWVWKIFLKMINRLSKWVQRWCTGGSHRSGIPHMHPYVPIIRME